MTTEQIPSIRRALQARNRQQHAETELLIAEYELLKGTDNPKTIAIRMGYAKPTSLARRFMRYGRHDLAKGLWD